MRKPLRSLTTIVIFAILCLALAGCGNNKPEPQPWESAAYTEDAEFGQGSKTIEVAVMVEDKTVTFTLKTDKDNLEEALTEHNLISGKKGPYGMYVKVVNGITADYDIDRTYWSLTKNGAAMLTGVTDTKISDGEHYELTYTK